MAIDTTKQYKQITVVMPQKVTPNYFANLAQKATPASTDEVLLIDNAAGGAAKRTTVPAVAQQAANGVNVPRSSGASLYALDSANTGNTIAIANNATATPLGAGVALRGLMMLWSNTDGVGALIFADAGAVSIVSDRGGICSAVQGTASKLNVYVTGSTLTIENKRGVTTLVSVTAWRLA